MPDSLAMAAPPRRAERGARVALRALQPGGPPARVVALVQVGCDSLPLANATARWDL